MLNTIRKINLKTAGILAIVFYLLTILLHILVLTGVLSYQLVNGGRSESVAAQLPLSASNLVIALVGLLFSLFASRIIPNNGKKVITIVCWIFVVLWTVGFFQQLLGTVFEKTAVALLLLLGVIAHLRLAIEER